MKPLHLSLSIFKLFLIKYYKRTVMGFSWVNPRFDGMPDLADPDIGLIE